ncbi:ubiquinol oxidase subunit II [Sphingomonas sp. ASV193]|uniref:ubiquinol oxidase subunit II n=1 Tax=Sphingomonas sp. ASV193 TaxID=3144405 RepID=UPI0032E8EFB2
MPTMGNAAPRRARAALLAAGALCLAGCGRGVLGPQGPVAEAERTLLLNSLGIMLAIVIPTILATIAFAWWYRAGNKRAVYDPDFVYSGQVELVVWAIPAMVVLLLGGIAWIGSQQLEPSRPLASSVKPVQVEVVSLDWKWLFIYPEQGVASVNRLVIPAGTPVQFQLTSDGVMNSFFVPQLGSQIYTMSGMVTRLNLQADRPGRFAGMSAQYSGDGFADMRFSVDALAPADFARWAASSRGAGPALDAPAFAKLAQRSSNVPPTQFGAVDAALFANIVAGRAAAPPPPAVVDGQTQRVGNR